MHHRLAVAFAFLIAAGCTASGSSQVQCTTGADCNSGVCNADGTCADSPATGGGGSGGSTGSASTGGGGSGSGAGGSGGSKVCAPNGDGTITRAEVPLAAGLHATFKATENAKVDTAGKTQADGSRVWDLSGPLQGDHGELVETLPLAGQWFASSFPGATYAARLSDTSNLLGVFEINDTALLLRGVVSPTSASPKTLLTHMPPVTVLSFPIVANKTWSTTASVTGTAQDVPIVGFDTENYQSTVDAHGTLKTPFADFPVFRIRVELTRTVGALITTTRTFSFVTECFGTVANVVSTTNEPIVEFTNAAEVARLSP